MSQRYATSFAMVRARGERWHARRPMRQQERWAEHAAFMDAFADDGFVILGRATRCAGGVVPHHQSAFLARAYLVAVVATGKVVILSLKGRMPV